MLDSRRDFPHDWLPLSESGWQHGRTEFFRQCIGMPLLAFLPVTAQPVPQPAGRGYHRLYRLTTACTVKAQWGTKRPAPLAAKAQCAVIQPVHKPHSEPDRDRLDKIITLQTSRTTRSIIALDTVASPTPIPEAGQSGTVPK